MAILKQVEAFVTPEGGIHYLAIKAADNSVTVLMDELFKVETTI